MRKTVIMAAATIILALLWACEKNESETPFVSDINTSGCHTSTDKLAVKDMSTDSIVVFWPGTGNSMQVTHYNMVLDCGEPHITTTVETNGNTFHINNLPPHPFTLIIKVESIFCGTPEQTTIYENTF